MYINPQPVAVEPLHVEPYKVGGNDISVTCQGSNTDLRYGGI